LAGGTPPENFLTHFFRINARVYEATQSYQYSLYFFGGSLIVALIISLLMKLEMSGIHRRYSSAEVEATRAHQHGE
jgi:hypothetical protein